MYPHSSPERERENRMKRREGGMNGSFDYGGQDGGIRGRMKDKKHSSNVLWWREGWMMSEEVRSEHKATTPSHSGLVIHLYPGEAVEIRKH